jgi:hypothetical protein
LQYYLLENDVAYFCGLDGVDEIDRQQVKRWINLTSPAMEPTVWTHAPSLLPGFDCGFELAIWGHDDFQTFANVRKGERGMANGTCARGRIRGYAVFNFFFQ